MDSINSWVDEEEIKKIASRLLSDEPEAKDWEAENFEGFAVAGVAKAESDDVRTTAGRSLAEASALAKRAGLLREEKAVVSGEVAVERAEETEVEEERVHVEQVSARGALGEMDDVMRDAAGATGVCVVDRDGDVLHDSMGNGAWTRFVVLAANRAARPEIGGVYQRVSGAMYLQLIPAVTSRGGILIGLLVPKPVSGDVSKELGAKAVEIADR